MEEGNVPPRASRRYIAFALAAPLLLPLVAPDPPHLRSLLMFSDVSPNGGEVLSADSSSAVLWNASHDGDSWMWATVTYSVDGGASSLFLTKGDVDAQSGAYGWRVPRFNTTAGRVLVCGFAPDGHAGCLGSANNFTILAAPPYLDLLSPFDGAVNVSPGAPIVLGAEGVDPASVVVTVDSPTPISYMWSWSGDFRMLTLAHTNPFPSCWNVRVTAAATGTDGTPLGPYDWTFKTQCLATIVDFGVVDPLLGPIYITFSQPVNRSSFAWQITPSVTLNPIWQGHNTVLLLYPSPAFDLCTQYTFMLSGGRNMDGDPILPGPFPNPMSFYSSCPFYIVWTDPADGDVDVPLGAPIIVEFSQPGNTASIIFHISPDVSPWTYAWSNADTRVTLLHGRMFDPCTMYTVWVESPDLVPGPVPNPWSFTTECVLWPPAGLRIERRPPDDIRLSWNAVANGTLYRVYESPDRLAPFPWRVLGETAEPSFDARGHLRDGSDHFYVVRAVRGGNEGPNSSMAAKSERDVRFDPGSSNVFWISLPYRSEYRKASDISAELTESNVDVFGRWNPATQRTALWYFFRGSWRGTDFSIGAGDGIFFSAKRPFTWTIVGTDAPTVLTFTTYPAPSLNYHGISLPYTAPYATAKDLVRDIEGSDGATANTKIIQVSKWDAATQSLMTLFWTPTGWIGTDFVLLPGEGVYFRTVSDFAWLPRLLTPEVP